MTSVYLEIKNYFTDTVIPTYSYLFILLYSKSAKVSHQMYFDNRYFQPAHSS